MYSTRDVNDTLENHNADAMSYIQSVFGNITIDDAKAEAYEKEQEILHAEKVEVAKQTHYEHSGVGSKYWKLRLEDFVADTDELKDNYNKVVQTIESIKAKKPRTLWLCGENGNGKTLLASMIVRECYGKYVSMYNIEDDIKDAENFKNDKNRKQVFEMYANENVLVIDEIGRFPDDRGVELKYLFHILNDRYMNNKSTVLVTNLSVTDLKKYLGKALTDRFIESCVSCSFTGASYRVNERCL